MSTGTSPGAARQDAGDADDKAGQVRDMGAQIAGQAQEKATHLADQAQETAQQAADQATDRLREQLDQRSAQVASQINQQASDLRSVSEALRQQGNEGPAKAADKLAGYAERVGGYLREKDSDALLSDAEEFGRNQPWTVGAGAVAIGFAAARFLKASSSRRYASRYPGRDRASQLPRPMPRDPSPGGDDLGDMPASPSTTPGVT